MSTRHDVQAGLQVFTLDFQRVTPRLAVKIMTFAAGWQNLDAAAHCR